MTGLGTALLISGLVGAATETTSSVMQSSAAKSAANASANASQAQLTFAEQQARQDQINWERAMQFNIDQYNAQQQRLTPFRQIGANAAVTLNNLIGGSAADPSTFEAKPLSLPAVAGPFDASTTGSPTSTGSTPTSTTTTTGIPNASSLSGNAQAWMSLVGDKTKLASWLKATFPNMSDQNVNYYVGAIQRAPGANPQEQADGVNFWTKRITSDLAGGGSGTKSAGATTLNSLITGPSTPTIPVQFGTSVAPAMTTPRVAVAPGVSAPTSLYNLMTLAPPPAPRPAMMLNG